MTDIKKTTQINVLLTVTASLREPARTVAVGFQWDEAEKPQRRARSVRDFLIPDHTLYLPAVSLQLRGWQAHNRVMILRHLATIFAILILPPPHNIWGNVQTLDY